jgi:Flp pilus assembly pilin Flp
MNNRQSGGALTEYGLVLSLVIFLSIAALFLLGDSVTDVFKGNSSVLASSSVQQLVSLQFNQSNIPPGKGKLTIDSVTGWPVMQLSDSNTAGGVNTTSTEGIRATATNTMDEASQLSSALSQISDPDTREWAEQITRLAYYLGGAEGSYAGVSSLAVNPTDDMHPQADYNQAAALSDIYTYQKALLTVIQYPPSGANPEEVQTIIPLAVNVWNNAQVYVEELTPYFDQNGRLNQNALKDSPLNGGNVKLSNLSYDQIVAYDTLQSKVSQVLADGSASGTTAVQSTLQGATAVKQATTP